MTCTHRWRIAPPEGPLSEGVCKFCGERRQFKNSVAEWGPVDRALAHRQYCTTTEPLRMTEALKE